MACLLIDKIDKHLQTIFYGVPMNDFEVKVMNNLSIETVTKAIVNETAKWGFKPIDYITLVNALMDLSLSKTSSNTGTVKVNETPGDETLDFPLIGEQVRIRLFNRDTDFKTVQKWLEDEFGRWFLLSRSYTRDTTLAQLVEDERNILGLITLPDQSPIGLMGYLDHDKFHKKAEIRKLIGDAEYREKGFAKEATMLWIQYGIKNLKLKKIYLNTIENNIRNVTLNKELGFQVEGILRKECMIDTKYYDLLRMGLTVD